MLATINGTPFNIVESGRPDATPVIFLHGFPFSLAMWASQLEAVSKSYRAIAYDLRGHGDSFVGDGQFTIEMHADDLIAVMDHLNVPKAIVVGLSMGGYITLRALERNPERFHAAVLCDTRSEADTNEARLKRHAGAIQVKRDGSAAFAEGFVKAVFAPESLQRLPAATELIQNIIASTPPLSIAGTLIALAGRTDTSGALAGIHIPTMILVGEHDAITPPAAAEALHQRIPGSEMHVIPQAAHMSNLENPDVFNEKLLLFLKRVAPVGK